MPSSPARRLRDALEPIATLSFHAPPAQDAFAAAGLTEFETRYFWSRSSPLGEVEPAVVVAAFGVFEPGYATAGLRAGRAICSLAAVRAARDAGAGDATRQALGLLAAGEISDVTEVLRRGAAAADGTARELFAANRALPWPEDPHVALWRAATLWRELRGDSHLAACAVAGVTGLQANILNELDQGYRLGEYTATRNWPDDAIRAAADVLRDRGLLDGDDLSAAGQALRDRVEALTDTAVEQAVAAVGTDLDRVVDRANTWSQLIIDRGWFPDSARKRAAG